MKIKFLFSALILFLSQNILAQHLNSNTTPPRSSPFFNIDISGSSGNYNGKTYSEIHLGLNMNFTDWLTWRNAAFKRFSSAGQDLTGVDSSVRFILNNQFDGGGVKLFAGPGYRWADPSEKNALFGEAGAGLQLGRFGVGIGAKYLKYDKVQLDSNRNETKRDDLNYFITITGGAGLSF